MKTVPLVAVEPIVTGIQALSPDRVIFSDGARGSVSHVTGQGSLKEGEKV